MAAVKILTFKGYLGLRAISDTPAVSFPKINKNMIKLKNLSGLY